MSERKREPATSDDVVRILACLRTFSPSVSRAHVLAALKRDGNLHLRRPDTLVRNIAEQAALLECNPSAVVRAALRAPSLFGSKASTLAEKVDRAAAVTGVPRASLVRVALKKPELLYLNPEHLAANVLECMALLGVSRETFGRMALRHPTLLTMRPQRLAANIEAVCTSLGIVRAAYARAGVKQPQLLYQSPDTLIANVRGSANGLGINEGRFLKAALQQPGLFYLRPDTVCRTAQETAKALGVGVGSFITAALNSPSLFYQRPESVALRVENSAKLLGVSANALLVAAMSRPTLLLLKPKNMAAKAKSLRLLTEVIGEPLTTTEILASFPQAFIYAVVRIEAVTRFAKLSPRRRSFKSLLVRPRRIIDAELAKGEEPALPTKAVTQQSVAMLAMLLSLLASALGPVSAWAACSSPTGAEGSLDYDATAHQFKYCDQNDIWQPLGGGAFTGSGSATAVAYWSGASGLTYDADGFYWDAINNRLGIGYSTPAYALDVVSTSTSNVSATMLRLFSGAVASGESRTSMRIEKASGYGGEIAGYISQGVGSGLILSTVNGSATAERMRFTSAGNIGVGISTPTAALQVSGTFTVSLSTQVTTPTLHANGSGNVGIGTSLPSGTLHVASGDLVLGMSATAITVQGGPDIENFEEQDIVAYRSTTLAGLSSSPTWRAFGVWAGSGPYRSLMVANTNGNVGISNTSPIAKLDVGGTISASDVIQVSGSSLACASSVNGAMRWQSVSDTLQICTGSGWKSLASGTTAGSGVTGGTANYGAVFSGATTLTTDTALYIDTTNHRLGVGVSNPSTVLQVSGSLSRFSDRAWDVVGNYTYGDSFYSAFRGYRARGTLAAPTAVQSGDTLHLFDAYGYNGSSFVGAGGMGVLAAGNWSTTSASALAFFTNSGSSIPERMRIDSSGNVGIGTTAPAVRPNVSGTTTLQTGGTHAVLNLNQTDVASYNIDQNWYSNGALKWVTSVRSAASNDFWLYNATRGAVDLAILNSNGNIGIGTSSPLDGLDVVSGYGITQPGNQYIGSNIYYNSGWKYRANGVGAVLKLAESVVNGVTFQLAPNNASGAGAAATMSNVMTMLPSGGIGIGTSSPVAKLDVVGTISASNAIQVSGSSLACASSINGAIRWQSTSDTLQICTGSGWKSLASSTTAGGASALSGLSDVAITNVANRDYLRYDTVSSKWKNISESVAMSTTTVRAGFPDAINCSNAGSGSSYLYLPQWNPYTDGKSYYIDPYNGDVGRQIWNSDGTYSGSDNGTVQAGCTNKSISQLYAEGRAFNFIGAPGRWTDTYGFTYLNANNVGIGLTVSSTAKLEVAGTVSSTGVQVSGSVNASSLKINGNDLIPTGAVMAFDLASCPGGWSEYTAARGRFLRGIDAAGTQDPSGTRTAGGQQGDAFQGHWHQLYTDSPVASGYAGTGGRYADGSGAGPFNTNVRTALSDGTNGTPRTSSETRPKNVAVLFCRKD